MDLLVDIGNTCAKMALSDGEAVVVTDLLSADRVREWDEKFGLDRGMACVVGKMPDFSTILPKHLRENFSLLSAETRLPMAIDYETPGTLGSDRIAAAVGALSSAAGAFLVVDAGTCITFDFVDEHRVYRGGAILPGVSMKFKALNTFTAKLPLLEKQSGAVPLVGRSTEGSIRSGVLNGTLLEVQGFVDRYRALAPGLSVFLTGGDAELLASAVPDAVVSDGLIWKGLMRLLQ